MSIPGIYTHRCVVSLTEDITYLDVIWKDQYHYTLFEITYLGFLRKRIYRYRAHIENTTRHRAHETKVYAHIIRPWLRFRDQPLKDYLSRVSPSDS